MERGQLVDLQASCECLLLTFCTLTWLQLHFIVLCIQMEAELEEKQTGTLKVRIGALEGCFWGEWVVGSGVSCNNWCDVYRITL